MRDVDFYVDNCQKHQLLQGSQFSSILERQELWRSSAEAPCCRTQGAQRKEIVRDVATCGKANAALHGRPAGYSKATDTSTHRRLNREVVITMNDQQQEA
jgi:hypothetical protein